jgi:hypothetical protein
MGGRDLLGWENGIFGTHLDLPLSISYNPAKAKVFTVEKWQNLVGHSETCNGRER